MVSISSNASAYWLMMLSTSWWSMSAHDDQHDPYGVHPTVFFFACIYRCIFTYTRDMMCIHIDMRVCTCLYISMIYSNNVHGVCSNRCYDECGTLVMWTTTSTKISWWTIWITNCDDVSGKFTVPPVTVRLRNPGSRDVLSGRDDAVLALMVLIDCCDELLLTVIVSCYCEVLLVIISHYYMYINCYSQWLIFVIADP